MSGQLPPDRLEAALFELGRRVGYPPTPDLGATVRRRIAAGRCPAVGRSWLRAAAAVALAAVLVIALVPPVRQAVAGWFGIGVEFVDELPPLGRELGIGEPQPLEAVRREAGFTVLVPELLGDPDEAYLDDRQRVWLLYRAGEGRPETAIGGVGVLVAEFPDEAGFPLAKLVDPAVTTVEMVTVGGREALWIEGAPHGLVLGTDRARLAANTLLWQQDDLTLRIESALTLDESVAIAESLR